MRFHTLLAAAAAALLVPAAAQAQSEARDFGGWNLLSTGTGCLVTYQAGSDRFQMHASTRDRGLVAVRNTATEALADRQQVSLDVSWSFDGVEKTVDVTVPATAITKTLAFAVPIEATESLLEYGPRIRGSREGRTMFNLKLPAGDDTNALVAAFKSCRLTLPASE